MSYTIEIADDATEELRRIRVFDRRRIVDTMREKLKHQPALQTRNRKRLDALAPGFEHVPPVWELRVGSYRVFYDVDGAAQVVYVRAVRRKAASQTAEDIAR
jgi:mRNA-degrading endonuclease RelE of RelBE toxin-antitoxin system